MNDKGLVAKIVKVVGGHGPAVAAKPVLTASTSPKQETEAIPVAVDIGWTMAVLFGQLENALINYRIPVNDRLPTEHELGKDERIDLELQRLKTLLARLEGLFPANLGRTLTKIPLAPGNAPPDKPTLNQAHLEILRWLACAGREYGIAYQLGRSLRDTAAPPLRDHGPVDSAAQADLNARVAELEKTRECPPAQGETPQEAAQNRAGLELQARDAMVKQLERLRVARLQDWLSTLASYLPDNSGPIVSASLGRWSDVITAIFVSGPPGKLRKSASPPSLSVAAELTYALLPQGDAWVNLLVGAESSDGLLTPEGLVAAGEAALRRTARIVRKIAWHYWFVLVVLVAAVAAAVFFAARDLAGASRIWTQIAAVAGGLGITAKGTTNTMARLSKDAEKTLFGAEKTDAMAWAVTTIPDQLKLSYRGIRALRRSGIPASGPMGRS